MGMLDRRILSDSSSSIDALLRDLDMPSDEIHAVVAADQPLIVHRYMELHRERLQERLADQVRTLERLERILTPATCETSRPRVVRPSSEGGPSLHGLGGSIR